MNALFVEVPIVPIEFTTMSEMSELLKNTTDVLPEMFLKFEGTAYDVYPMGTLTLMIIVPKALPYSEFSSYLRNVASDTFVGCSVIAIAATTLLLIFIRYNKRKKFLFFQSVTDVLNLLMNDNGYIEYQRLSRVEVSLIVPLTFFGLVFVNGILSNLQSYLTRPILQPQINTIAYIYRFPFERTIEN